MLGHLARSSYDLIRRRISSRFVYRVFDRSLHGLSYLLRLYPGWQPARNGVEVLCDLPYSESPLAEHTLDVYRPLDRKGPLPMILYVHGGSFSSLSKDTHWLLGLRFASQGFLVFNINYRLAPRYPFPAALLDCCKAYRFIVRHGPEYGGDLCRLALAGESAGANLITTLALCTSYERTALKELFDLGVRPAAVIAACGLLQVSDSERLLAQHPTSSWLRGLSEMLSTYLLPADGVGDELRALVDPLLFLERSGPPQQPLPAFFVPVGTRDPLLDDSRRLAAALKHLGADCDARYYEGEIHAFHTLLWRRNAQRCWQDIFSFLNAHLGQSRGQAEASRDRDGVPHGSAS